MQKRLGEQWDATNAMELLRYLSESQQADKIFFELGNEPYYPQLRIDGQRIAMDFQILRRLLDAFPGFGGTRLVGADFDSIDPGPVSRYGRKPQQSVTAPRTRLVGPSIGMADVDFLESITSDFAKYAAHTVDAVTIHHYYFRGPGAKIEQFYDLQHFNAYPTILAKWLDVIYKGAGFEIPVWVGETADAYSYGAPNITNRYVSGFLWLDKLGVSARMGVKLVARQDLFGGNYPLLDAALDPNPDYWLSHVFKQLVGTTVLSVSIDTTDSTGYLRAYAHGSCQSNTMTKLTVFAINLSSNDTATVKFSEQYSPQMSVYAMTPGPGGLLSQSVLLNGETLKLVDDHTLPTLKPKVIATASGYTLQPLTFAFIVFDVNIPLKC